MGEEENPIKVANTLVKSLLDIVIVSIFVTSGERLAMKTKINETKDIQFGDHVNRGRISNPLFFKLTSDGVKITKIIQGLEMVEEMSFREFQEFYQDGNKDSKVQ